MSNKNALLSFFEKLVTDVVLFNLSTLIAVWLRFDYSLKISYVHIDDPYGILENVIFIIFVLILEIPTQMWEFTSVKEISDVVFVVTLTKIVSGVFLYVFRSEVTWSRGAYLISWIVAILLLAGARLFVRVIKERRNVNAKDSLVRKEKNVLIVGAGDAGEKVIREIAAHPELNYRIVGILDDNPHKKLNKIHGFPVLDRIEGLPSVVRRYNVDTIIIAIPSASRQLLRKIVSLASDTPAEIKTLPSIWEIIDGKVTINSIRDVKLEDLLPRPEIVTDTSDIEKYVSGKKILVTGAGGSIGSEIARQVAKFGPALLILLDKSENGVFRVEMYLKEKFNYVKENTVVCDIRNRGKIFRIFEKYKPDVVFHAAAHKHVPLMEKNPDEAVTNNIFGTKNLLDAALNSGVCRFVSISTDKAVNPTSVMGASKRVIELMLKYYTDKGETIFTSVRFGNVLGSAGSVIEIFNRQIKETGVLTITDPRMERYFMLIPEAVQLVLHAGALGEGGEIFVLKMGERVNIMELAKTYAKLSGLEVGKDVKIKIIGNRGGEKLFEELWGESEITERTENPYILRIKTSANGIYDSAEFFEKLKQLNEAANNLNFKHIREIFSEIIPEAKLDETKDEEETR
jgi:FlaA1/EpsC-like NDP-sugar epimerase